MSYLFLGEMLKGPPQIHTHAKQHMVIAFSRYMIIKGRMTPFKIVGVDILSNCNLRFIDIVIYF